jgi:hypothetical protein
LIFIRRNLPLPITLQLYRRSVSSSSIKIDKIVLNSVDQHQPLNSDIFSKKCEQDYSFNDRTCLLPETLILKTKPEQSLLMSPIHPEQSDGSESGVGSESNPYSDGEHRLVCDLLLLKNKILIICFLLGNDFGNL